MSSPPILTYKNINRRDLPRLKGKETEHFTVSRLRECDSALLGIDSQIVQQGAGPATK
jgi:hypothetical protein